MLRLHLFCWRQGTCNFSARMPVVTSTVCQHLRSTGIFQICPHSRVQSGFGLPTPKTRVCPAEENYAVVIAARLRIYVIRPLSVY